MIVGSFLFCFFFPLRLHQLNTRIEIYMIRIFVVVAVSFASVWTAGILNGWWMG